jgi:Eco57I restriction-modification methylase/MmeI, target recognition domain
MASFPSVRIEGGLLGPELLDQLAAGELRGQKPADFGLEPRRNLTDEIAAVRADAQALWGVFQHRLARLPENDLATSVTRDAWIISLLGLLGYEPRYNPRAYEVDGLTFAISHRAGEAEDSPPIHIVGARQELGRVPPSGRPRLAPHSLVQEYLNRRDHVWGIVTNGLTLRLLRDSTLVRRQSYVEFDLEAIFDEQRFGDFSMLYRLLHRTRLPRGAADASDCLLEHYYTQSIEQGGRVREHLRDGVKLALEAFANGFLAHPANAEFCSDLATGRFKTQSFYQELLRLIYRLLFLMVSEERNLLVSRRPEQAAAAEIYRTYYSVSRIRRLVDLVTAYTEHDDVWQGLRTVFRCLQDDKFGPFLGLPALNGELFNPITVDGLSLRNRDFLTGFWHLSNYEDERSHTTRRVNYSALDVEELGSVYESLLEFHPHLDLRALPPRFELSEEGGERRSTGSHYTPPELVAPFIKHALDPVLEERLRAASTREQKQRAILSLKVCDLASGSGHFLLAAARRLGKELARVNTGEDEPSPERMREAIRDVITHCIYGVDKNPLAVELCRVALWLEGHAEDKPLTFLDHRIRCGDSLVGVFDLKSLEHGIPDEAFKPVTGEDRTIAREAKTRNTRERAESLLQFSVSERLKEFARRLQELDELPEDTIEQVRTKAEAYRRVESSPEFQRLRFACDIWTAAFFQKFSNGSLGLVTTDALRRALSMDNLSDGRLTGWIEATAQECHFFHWPLAFSEVFAVGGFDVFLGNPPFLGGLKISTELGDKYRHLVSTIFNPFPGTADLCAAFFRRAFKALNPTGRVGLIATNTISQGDTREAGLAPIKADGGFIVFAKRYVKWPGKANVEVNLTALSRRAPATDVSLDDQLVPEISSRLDDEPESEPSALLQNESKCFIGDYVRGMGFVLDSQEAQRLLQLRSENRGCLLPFLNGEDFNDDYNQHPARYVICFHEFNLRAAEGYPDLLQIVRERVKPFRDGLRDKNEREHWWLFARYRGELRRVTQGLSRYLARTRHSEFHMMDFADSGWIASDAMVVFAFDEFFYFALLQSNVHEAWVWKHASSLESRNRYTPTDCFETFAFPQAPAPMARAEAARLGEAYHEHRRQTKLARGLGLTKTYNLFHKPQCGDADIARLRELHAVMDRAILACYKWADIDPDHGFHANERGQTRYTISPVARREILRRLLALNLEIAAREAAGASSRTPSLAPSSARSTEVGMKG